MGFYISIIGRGKSAGLEEKARSGANLASSGGGILWYSGKFGGSIVIEV